jgi:hypothetical protein
VLSADTPKRIFLGAVGARWLQSFKKCIDDPLKMLL